MSVTSQPRIELALGSNLCHDSAGRRYLMLVQDTKGPELRWYPSVGPLPSALRFVAGRRVVDLCEGGQVNLTLLQEDHGTEIDALFGASVVEHLYPLLARSSVRLHWD